MVRRSQSSNPRSTVVLTSGTDWGTRAAGQRRASGAEVPVPRRQPAKIKALHQALGLARAAINRKNWNAARYALSRARAVANALPADVAVQEREQLSALRKKYAARDTPAARAARQAKGTPVKRTGGGGKKAASKPTAQQAPARKAVRTLTPKPAPVRELGDRLIDRASLGYAPRDEAGGRPV
ncbi:hypothetical protein [Streptomyces sp. NBC_00334]|uniref:hypothetical protein n=1 Tax=Streptomyces sp. NBC_00334 TaxID=2975713 RepID=UPI002E286179|nr:hypothetical protein [Streptomyces sp. NBC_00334]